MIHAQNPKLKFCNEKMSHRLQGFFGMDYSTICNFGVRDECTEGRLEAGLDGAKGLSLRPSERFARPGVC